MQTLRAHGRNGGWMVSGCRVCSDHGAFANSAYNRLQYSFLSDWKLWENYTLLRALWKGERPTKSPHQTVVGVTLANLWGDVRPWRPHYISTCAGKHGAHKKPNEKFNTTASRQMWGGERKAPPPPTIYQFMRQQCCPQQHNLGVDYTYGE